MAAPSATARATPSGIPLENGYQVLVTFASDTDVSFWEESITPPGAEGGDAIDTTTQHNTDYVTKAPQALTEHTNGSMRVSYDPGVLSQIHSLINVEDEITITFPDGSTWSFWGFLKNFQPDVLENGTKPQADIEFVVTNWDPNNNAEAGPTVTSVEGT